MRHLRSLRSSIGIALAALLVLFSAVPAHADGLTASIGIGFHSGVPGEYVGTFLLSNGQHGYCADIERGSPIGPTYDAATDHGVHAVGIRQRVNYILNKWGDTIDPVQAAAVQWALWRLMASQQDWDSHQWLWGAIPDGALADVRAKYELYLAESATQAVVAVSLSLDIAYATGDDSAVVTPRLTVRRANGQYQQLPGGAHQGTITVTGGSWSTTGSPSTIQVGNGESRRLYAPRGIGVAAYTVQARFDNLPYSDQLSIATPTVDGSRQRLAIATPATVDVSQRASASWDLRVPFEPVIATVASMQQDGDEPHALLVSDRIAVTVASTPMNPTARWGVTETGSPVPVTLVASLIGPLDAEPDHSETIPADAPVVAATRITVTGPGVYATEPVPAVGPGYFTWVAALDLTETPASSREYLTEWQSAYGDPAETVLDVWRPTVETQASAERVRLGESLHDTITVSGNRPGLALDVISELYGPFDARPDAVTVVDHHEDDAVSPVPEHAQLVGSVTTTVIGDGTTRTAPLEVPHEGYYVWVETIAGTTETTPWRSSFGEIAETTLVEWVPEVSTRLATDSVLIGADVVDRVEVTGLPDGFPIAGVDAEPVVQLTMYGPFEERPAQSGEVPDDAPVHDTREVAIEWDGETWAATSAAFRAFAEPGYYTVVAILPEGERTAGFVSDFGLDDETVEVRVPVPLVNTGAAGGVVTPLIAAIAAFLGALALVLVRRARRSAQSS